MSPLELALLTNLLLCSFVLKWLIISTTQGLLMACLDVSRYHDPSSPTIHTVLNMLGICSWVFIHITVGPFHTTVTSEPPKELRVHFLPFSRVWGWGMSGGGSKRFQWKKQGNRKFKSKNDKCLCGRLGAGGGVFISLSRENLLLYLFIYFSVPCHFYCMVDGFFFLLFPFPFWLSAMGFSNGFHIWSYLSLSRVLSVIWFPVRQSQ